MINQVNAPFLRLKNIDYFYHHKRWVLKNINLDLELGETLGVVGPNGGGKSTLVKIIAGLLRPKAGEIYFKGSQLSSPKEYLKHIGLVSQSQNLNLALPITVEEFLRADQMANGLSATDHRNLVHTFGLEQMSHCQMRELSGGEKQRVLLARAMMKNPSILIFDEPTTGLDAQGQDNLLGLIQELQKSKKHIFIIVDHNLTEVIKLSTKLICLNKTFHWHDHKQYLNKKILGDIYHCEFEHLALHDLTGELAPHHQCSDGPGHTHGPKKDENS